MRYNIPYHLLYIPCNIANLFILPCIYPLHDNIDLQLMYINECVKVIEAIYGKILLVVGHYGPCHCFTLVGRYGPWRRFVGGLRV